MSEVVSAPTPSRGAVPAILALALAISAPFSWTLLMDQVWLRSTGVSAWVPIGLAVALAVHAWRHDRRWMVRGIAVLALVVGALFSFMFLVALRLQPSTGFAALTTAPDFTLPDHEGRTVRLRDPAVKGPTLLVFFRGHW